VRVRVVEGSQALAKTYAQPWSMMATRWMRGTRDGGEEMASFSPAADLLCR
jgi:hypothetical protein